MSKSKSNGSRGRAAAAQTDLSRFQEGRWDLPRCFIIHAWSPPGVQHVISQIKTALKDNFHVIVDQDFGAGESIRKQALDGIRDAALVVAIMDDLRPNVVFELGYALALKKPCIPLVREGAVVNVCDYFPEDQREGVANPALGIDAHFSDLKDLKWCPYDHENPTSPGAVIADELSKKGADGLTLGRRALQTWVDVLRSAYEPKGKCFDELYEYIRKSTVRLGRPLFATRRKTRFNELFTKGTVCRAKKTPGKAKPARLPDAVIEAAADLPHEARLSLLQTLLKSYPNDPRLRFSECYTVAMLAEETGYKDAARCGEALRLHEAFLEKWPEYAEAHYNCAILLKSLKRPEEAEEHYREALRIRPEYAEAHYNYANLLSDLKRPEEAEEHYCEALRITPDHAKAWANLGRLFQDLGRTAEARKAYERALALADRLPEGGGERVRKWLDQLGGDEGASAPGKKG